MRGAILCLMMVLAGCTLHANHQAALPPPPKPDAVKPPAEPPLSIPQTAAGLNVPREWNAAAIPLEPPPAPPPQPKVEAPPVAPNPRRAAAPTVKQPETAEAPGTTGSPDTTTEEPAAVPPATDTAPFQPIVPVEQQNQLKTAIANRRRDVINLLGKAEHGGNDKTQIEKIKSFLNLAEEAEKRGDYTQADSLSARALLMAQDLKVE